MKQEEQIGLYQVRREGQQVNMGTRFFSLHVEFHGTSMDNSSDNLDMIFFFFTFSLILLMKAF